MRAAKSPDNPGYCISCDAEAQLNNSEAFYCKAIENADGVPFQLIFGQHTGEGYYLNVGTGIRQLLGIAPEEFTEKRFHEIVDTIVPMADGFPSELSECREKFIGGDLKSYKAEVLIRMPGGEKKWIQDSSLPLIDEETGKVIGAFGILFDIDERKQTMIRMEKDKCKAEEDDRLKSAFIRNISHEIRTPLNAIVGYSALLCDDENTHGKQREYMDVIFRSTDHLLEIIDDIVEISNIEAGTVKVRREEIDLNAMFRRIYDRFRAKAGEKNITLRYTEEPGESEINIFTDGFKLSQTLSYLINNAMKFTKEGEVEFGYTVKDNRIEFYVSDTGIGIPKKHHPMIFNRFYQADNSSTRRFEGTGLGLSISKAYVELLGGEIWFTSKSGNGSVFYFTLPYNRAEG